MLSIFAGAGQGAEISWLVPERQDPRRQDSGAAGDKSIEDSHAISVHFIVALLCVLV